MNVYRLSAWVDLLVASGGETGQELELAAALGEAASGAPKCDTGLTSSGVFCVTGRVLTGLIASCTTTHRSCSSTSGLIIAWLGLAVGTGSGTCTGLNIDGCTWCTSVNRSSGVTAYTEPPCRWASPLERSQGPRHPGSYPSLYGRGYGGKQVVPLVTSPPGPVGLTSPSDGLQPISSFAGHSPRPPAVVGDAPGPSRRFRL